MKNKMLWIGSVIILFLSVICFVVFGVGTEIIQAITGAGAGTVYGKYDGKPISLEPNSEFANAVQRYTDMVQRNQGDKEIDETTYFYIYTYAFNDVVQSIASKSEVKKSGYRPSSETISRVMLPYFTGADGKFDPKLYESVPEADRNSFRASISEQLTSSRFSEDYFGSAEQIGGNSIFGRKASEKEINFLKNMISEKRSFDLVSYNKLNYPDSEVKAFALENAAMFNKYSLSVITCNDESTAKKVAGQIANNEITFKDAVTSFSEKYYSNGEGKIIESYEYQIKENLDNSEDFAKISALKADEISPVIKTARGYSIYRCDGESVKADFDNADTLNSARTYISEKESGRIEDYFIDKANSFVTEATVSGFDKAADKEGLTLTSVPAFPLNYGDADIADRIPTENIKEFTYANSSENLLEKAFSLKLNEISEPVVLGNYIIVLKLTGIQKEEATSDTDSKIAISSLNYDQYDAQSTLLSSKKVENKVSDVYFNKILASR